MFHIIAFPIFIIEAVIMIVMLMAHISRRKVIWRRVGPVLYILTCLMLLIIPFFLASIASRSWDMMT